MKTHRRLPPSWNLQLPQAYQQTYLDHGAAEKIHPVPSRAPHAMERLLPRAQRGRAVHLPAGALICSAAGGTCSLRSAICYEDRLDGTITTGEF